MKVATSKEQTIFVLVKSQNPITLITAESLIIGLEQSAFLSTVIIVMIDAATRDNVHAEESLPYAMFTHKFNLHDLLLLLPLLVSVGWQFILFLSHSQVTKCK
jgi:hypothetical protein